MESDCILRVKELFLLAADLPRDERRRILDGHGRRDPDLRATVERLLAHADQDPGGRGDAADVRRLTGLGDRGSTHGQRGFSGTARPSARPG